MARPLDLSIIIVNYNTKELLKDCLKSIQTSQRLTSYEIFVVDNASSDKSVEMIKKDFPKVLLLANRQNLGFAKANNQAIKKAVGRYILLLNPDTKVEENTLGEMVRFMNNNPKVGVATCRVELPNSDLDRDCRRSFPTPWISLTKFSGLAKIFPRTKLFGSYQLTYLDEKKISEIDACVGAFMMVRREALAKVGLLDENFFFYGEDLDWCYSFKEKGWKIIYNPSVKIIHYKGASSGMKTTSKHLTQATADAKRRALVASTEAMKIFYQKHYLNEYPKIITALVFSGIWLLRRIRLLGV